MANKEITIRDIWTLYHCSRKILRLINYPRLSEDPFELSWKDVDNTFEKFSNISREDRERHSLSHADMYEIQVTYPTIIDGLKGFYSVLNEKYFQNISDTTVDYFRKVHSIMSNQLEKIENDKNINGQEGSICFDEDDECLDAISEMVSEFGDKGFIGYKSNWILLFKDIKDFKKARDICRKGDLPFRTSYQDIIVV